MAAVTATAGVIDSTANAATYATASFTPSDGDLLVFVTAITGTALVGTATDTDGGTYTAVVNGTRSAGATRIVIWVRDALITTPGAMTATVDVTGDNGTGCEGIVLAVAGMTLAGSSASRQVKALSNQGAGGTPAVTFDAAALTGNPTVGAVCNVSNPAAITEPSGWAERYDDGQGTPDNGLEVVSRDSGFTGTTITWGSTSATDFGALILELDASGGVEEESITEGAEASDTFVATVTAVSDAITQGAVASDTFTAMYGESESITEGATASDTFVARVATTAEIIETALAGAELGFVATIGETDDDGALASDSFVARVATSAAITEGALAADAFDGVEDTSANGSITEGATASDSFEATVAAVDASITEGAEAGDTFAATPAATGTIAEGATASDTWNATEAASLRSITDGARASDVFAARVVLVRADITEGALAGDEWDREQAGVQALDIIIITGHITRKTSVTGHITRKFNITGTV